jgi:agmatinase
VLAEARERVYVTLDADVFDPSLVPATGTPEPGGLTWRQVDRLLQRLCAEREVVGFDVSELAPIEGFRVSEYTLAKIIYRFIGYRFG